MKKRNISEVKFITQIYLQFTLILCKNIFFILKDFLKFFLFIFRSDGQTSRKENYSQEDETSDLSLDKPSETGKELLTILLQTDSSTELNIFNDNFSNKKVYTFF